MTSNYHSDTGCNDRLTGPETWRSLSKNILSSEGKDIVSADPNLSDSTIEKLLALGTVFKGSKFSFGEEQADDIGITTLSSCINDNPKATLAEVVGRYAEVRNTTFVETAIAIKELAASKGLKRYIHPEGRPVLVDWHPTYVAVFVAPPVKRVSQKSLA